MWAAESHSCRARLDNVIADIFAWKNLPIRSRFDGLVDEGVAGGVVVRLFDELLSLCVGQLCAVGVGLEGVPHDAVVASIHEILTARDADGTKPTLVSASTVVATTSEGIERVRRRFARNLRQVLLEIGIHLPGKVIVNLGERGVVVLLAVTRNGILNLVTELKVRHHLAVCSCARVRIGNLRPRLTNPGAHQIEFRKLSHGRWSLRHLQSQETIVF